MIRLETLHLQPRWLVRRVHTDAGLTGPGEATREGRCLTVETALHEMGRWLIGQDPRRIELDEEKIGALRFGGRWDHPRWAHTDGGLAEW